MQILGLLGMYFDAVVVEAKTFLLLFRLALAILCYVCNFEGSLYFAHFQSWFFLESKRNNG